MTHGKNKLKLAYVSPLPPQHSGISQYSRELIPELYRYYDIDVVVDQDIVEDKWIVDHCGVVDAHAFRNDKDKYDRILYHFGNSKLHEYMFPLLLDIPGVVVLHDFYLSGVLSHMGTENPDGYSLEDELFYSHGNAPFNRHGYEWVTEYPINKKVIDYARGVIVHSEYSVQLAKEWYGKLYGENWQVIPLLRKRPVFNKRKESRQLLDIPENAFLVCSFGHLGPTKLNVELLEAWFDSALCGNENAYLCFVGENDTLSYGMQVQQIIDENTCAGQIKLTGWIDNETYFRYLSASDVAVQLRTNSRGETSASILDCMNYGIATIVNANGSAAAIQRDSVEMLPDEFAKHELIKALETLRSNKKKREELGRNAKHVVDTKHSLQFCAESYAHAVEFFYAQTQAKKYDTIELIDKLHQAEENYLSAINSFSYRITKPIRVIRAYMDKWKQ